MELILIDGCKSKKRYEKTRHVRNNDKSKKYIFRGEKNVRMFDRIFCNNNKTYNFTTKYCTNKHMTSVAKDRTRFKKN